MMKKIWPLLIIALPLFAAAQNYGPVTLSCTALKKKPGVYEVEVKASIQEGWYVYAQSSPEEGGLPARINFAKNPLLQFTDGVKEVGRLEKKWEPSFGVTVQIYHKEVRWVQGVQLRGKAKTALKGTLELMSCNGKECLPPATLAFSIPINGD